MIFHFILTCWQMFFSLLYQLKKPANKLKEDNGWRMVDQGNHSWNLESQEKGAMKKAEKYMIIAKTTQEQR